MIFLLLFALTTFVTGCPPPFNDMRFLANATHSSRDLILAYKALDNGGTGYNEVTSNNGNLRSTWPGGLVEYCFADDHQESYLREDIEAAWKLWTDKIGQAGERSGHSLVFRDYEFTDTFGQESWPYCYNKRNSDRDSWSWNAEAPHHLLVFDVVDTDHIESIAGYIPESYNDLPVRHLLSIPNAVQREEYIRVAGRDYWISQLAHELGHVFGLYHEHQRSDRAHYVEFNCDAISGATEARDEVDRRGNVHDWALVCHDPVIAIQEYGFTAIANYGTLPDVDDRGMKFHWTAGAEYDKDSIMHYHSLGFWPDWGTNSNSRTALDKPLSFWKNGGPNFDPPDFTEEKDLEFITPRMKPSDGDYKAIRTLYPWTDSMDECSVGSPEGDVQNKRRQTSNGEACPQRDEPLPYPYATEELYLQYRCKGEAFYKAMHESNSEAGHLFTPARESAESEFESAASLSTWSWKDFKVALVSMDFKKQWAVDHVLRALGLSDKSVALGGTIQVHGISHGDYDLNGGGYGDLPYDKQAPYLVDGKSYKVTGSEYTFGIDSNAGVLIAMDRRSPKYAGDKRNPKIKSDELPKLQSFSDVAWTKWTSTAGEPTKMRFFLSLAIINEQTRSIIGKILHEARYSWQPAWPGVTYTTDTPQGAALLGTPNALAFSYFLIQHKSTLGNLRISKVTIFKDGRMFADPCLLFYVEEAHSLPKKREKAGDLSDRDLEQTGANNYIRRHYLRAKL